MLRISVIVPFYNLERFAGITLESVVEAVRRAPEVSVDCVCVDDGSTDGTASVLDGFAARYGWMRVVRQSNGGEGSARNAGLAVAKGDWLMFLDGDDVWLPDVLVRAARTIVGHPEADIVNFRLQPFSGDDVPSGTDGDCRVYDTRRDLPSDVVLRVGVVPTCFRRDVFGDMRFGDLPLGADRLYAAECLVRAKSVVLSTACVYGYRTRSESMSHVVWNTRKIVSMIDYAVGSLRALSGSGKEVGREGVSYLADVLLSVTRKQIFRMREDRGEAVRHWREALISMDVRLLPFGCRVRRILMLALCRLIGFLV